MRFDESEFPSPELAFLAEQLAADAEAISGQHPPGSGNRAAANNGSLISQVAARGWLGQRARWAAAVMIAGGGIWLAADRGGIRWMAPEKGAGGQAADNSRESARGFAPESDRASRGTPPVTRVRAIRPPGL